MSKGHKKLVKKSHGKQPTNRDILIKKGFWLYLHTATKKQNTKNRYCENSHKILSKQGCFDNKILKVVGETNQTMNKQLSAIGYKGEILFDLEFFIKNEADFAKFSAFIIENDGKFQSYLQTAYAYMSILELQTKISKEEFVAKYSTNLQNFSFTKRFVLEQVFCRPVDKILQDKIDDLLNSGMSKEELYDSILANKGIHSPFNSIKLIAIKKNLSAKKYNIGWHQYSTRYILRIVKGASALLIFYIGAR